MAKAKTDGISNSDHIRRYIAEHPNHGPKAIVAGLHEQGIEVTLTLANQVKYSRKKAKTRPGRRKRTGRAAKLAAVRDGAAEGANKADHIRATIKELGRKFQTREVIDRLQAKGVVVTASHVRAVALRMGLRRRRRARPTSAATAGYRAAAKSDKWSLDDLVAAKRMAEQLGGIEAASRALAALAKLS